MSIRRPVCTSAPKGARVTYNGSAVQFHHPDMMGSTILATDYTQGKAFDRFFAPFGEIYDNAGGGTASFTGNTQDLDASLFDYQFREQSPTQGRWLNPDPSGLASVSFSDPQTLNRYSYVRNSAMRLVDVNGLSFGRFHGFAMTGGVAGNGSAAVNDRTVPGWYEDEVVQGQKNLAEEEAQNNSSSGGFWQKLGNALSGHGWKTNAEKAQDPTQVSVVGAKTSDYRGAGSVKDVLNQFHSVVTGMDKSGMRRTGSGEANGEMNDAQHWTNGYYGCQDQAYMAQTLLSGQHNGYQFVVQGEDPDPVLGGAYHNYEVVGVPDNPGNPTLFLSPWLNSATVVVPPQ